MAPATVLERARAALHERQDAGLAAGMGFTYRNPDRSTDPSRAVPGARSIIVAARSYLADERARRGRPARRRASPATRGSTTTPPLRDGLRAIAGRLRAADERAVPFADDNAIVDREVAHRAGLGWFGKNANLLLPGAGSWFVLGCVDHHGGVPAGRRRWPTGAASCQRCLDACPTGAIVAPGRDRRQPLPGLGAAAAGDDPRRAACRPSATASTAATTARRCARRPCASAAATSRPLDPDAEAWVDVLDLLDADDAHAARPPRPLVHRRARPAVAAPQRPRRARQHGRPATTQRVAATLARYRHGDDPVLAEHARWASERLGLPSPTTRRVAAREAPPRHERLPAQDRRDPVAAVGVVAAAAARPLRRAHQPVRRCRAVRQRPAVPHRADPRAGAAAAPVDGAPHRRPGRRGRRRARRARPGRAARARRSVAAAALRRRAARRRGHRARPPAGDQAGARQRAAPGPPRRVGRGVRRRARPSGPPSGRCRSPSCRPASTSSASSPLDAAERAAARRRFGLPVDAELIVSISRLVPRKGFDVAIEAVALLAPRRPDLVLAISGERSRRAPAAPARRRAAGARCASSAGSPTTTCRASTAAPTSSPWPAASRWGGLEQEGFGIVFVEAAACGVPQVAGDSGGAAEAVDDGVTGLVVRRPDDPREVAAAFEALLDDDALRASMAVASRAAGRRRVLLRRPGRTASARRSVCGDDGPTSDAAGDVARPRRRRRHRRCSPSPRRWRRRSSRRSGSGSPRSPRSRCSPSACSPSCGRTTTPCSAAGTDEIGVAQLYLLLGPPTPPRGPADHARAARRPGRHRRWSRRSPASTGPTASPARRSPSASSCRCSASASTGCGPPTTATSRGPWPSDVLTTPTTRRRGHHRDGVVAE